MGMARLTSCGGTTPPGKDLCGGLKGTPSITLACSGRSPKDWGVGGSGGSLGTVTSDWAIAGIADLDGDGKADILWRNITSGEVYEWRLNGTSVTGQGLISYITGDWQIAGIGDLNGDGKADVLWRNTTSG